MNGLRLIIILCVFPIFTFQIWADDAAPVVAVGQAGLDKDKIFFDDLQYSGNFSDSLRKVSVEVYETLKNDFAFYKHKFEGVDYSQRGKNSYHQPKYDDWREVGIQFVMSFVVDKKAKGFTFKTKVYSINESKILLETEDEFSSINQREKMHLLADKMYQSITKTPSIFTKKIYFVSDRTSRSKEIYKELYQMDFDGRNVDRLTSFNSIVLYPSVAPDNSHVLFSVMNKKQKISRGKTIHYRNIDLMAYDLTTRKTRIVSEKPGINSGAIYSSDGKKIYLSLSYSGNSDIYSLDVATQKLRKLTTHFSDEVEPSVNSAGDKMTFISGRSGKAHIYTMDPSIAEKDITRISFVGEFNGSPRFSPSGREIVFVSWVDNRFDIYRIDAYGNHLYRLTKDFGSNEEPSYSPDGEFIVFTSKRQLGRGRVEQNIHLMNREGEILGQLTQNFGRCFSASWSK